MLELCVCKMIEKCKKSKTLTFLLTIWMCPWVVLFSKNNFGWFIHFIIGFVKSIYDIQKRMSNMNIALPRGVGVKGISWIPLGRRHFFNSMIRLQWIMLIENSYSISLPIYYNHTYKLNTVYCWIALNRIIWRLSLDCNYSNIS